MDEEEQTEEPKTSQSEEEPISEDEEEEVPDGSLGLYNFDLMSVEGVDRIIALLPILDEDILKAIYVECFPGYPTDNISPRMARIELRGFFMHFLESENAVA